MTAVAIVVALVVSFCLGHRAGVRAVRHESNEQLLKQLEKLKAQFEVRLGLARQERGLEAAIRASDLGKERGNG